MPTYDYLCTSCGHEFEHFQAMSDEPLAVCPVCGSKVRRLISGGTGLIFKGTGFYLTDYKYKSDPSRNPPKKDKNKSGSKKPKENSRK